MESLEFEIGRAASFEDVERFKNFVGEVSTEDKEQSLKEVEQVLFFCSAILFSLFGSSKIYGLGSLIPAYTPLNKELKEKHGSFFLPRPEFLNKPSHRTYELRFYARGALFKILTELYGLQNGKLLKNENLSRHAKTFSQLMRALIKEIGDGVILVDSRERILRKKSGKGSYFLLKFLARLGRGDFKSQLKIPGNPDRSGYSALVL